MAHWHISFTVTAEDSTETPILVHPRSWVVLTLHFNDNLLIYFLIFLIYSSVFPSCCILLKNKQSGENCCLPFKHSTVSCKTYRIKRHHCGIKIRESAGADDVLWQWVTFYWRTNGQYVISPIEATAWAPARGRGGDKEDVSGFAIEVHTRLLTWEKKI